MDRVAGKIAVVSGAASGLGEASALILAREGATVVLACGTTVTQLVGQGPIR
ncbi:MAG: hypothetical protein Q7J57_14335 [Gemmobacter sp.]|nr:hypothetical protein [Gemmobacter sp.]